MRVLAAALLTCCLAASAAAADAPAAAETKASAPPPGFHSVTPTLTVHDAAGAIAFYIKAFDAREIFRVPGDDDTIVHAEIAIGDGVVFLADENPSSEALAPKPGVPHTASIHLYVRDVDAVFKQAVAAGAKPVLEPTDMPWNHRWAAVRDPYNHFWTLATPAPGVEPPKNPEPAAAAPDHPQF